MLNVSEPGVAKVKGDARKFFRWSRGKVLSNKLDGTRWMGIWRISDDKRLEESFSVSQGSECGKTELLSDSETRSELERVNSGLLKWIRWRAAAIPSKVSGGVQFVVMVVELVLVGLELSGVVGKSVDNW